jgi:hypothetical protein
MSNFYTKKYNHQIEISEIDFELYDSMFPNNWDAGADDEAENNHPESIIVNDTKLDWIRESYPVSIEKIEKILAELKESGCNHVEIMYHTDHIGYILTGVDIHVSTKEEIAVHLDNERIAEDAKKFKRIMELQKELSKLQSHE